MPVEQIPGSALHYSLMVFDAHGRERADETGELMSRRVLDVLREEPITDVFLLSHGWMGDVPGAREQYNLWIGAMAQCTADVEHMRQVRPEFCPLLIGLHWPSLPWGDEEMGGAAASFEPAVAAPVAELIERYAERIADTPAARAALRTIFTAAEADVAPPKIMAA